MPTSTDRVMGADKSAYNAVFTDKKDNASMDQMDFMKLLMTQMQNQDFTNPMDNSDMVQQMATFANMQAMQEMSSYSKTSYAMSLIGKTVTASRFTVGGNLDTVTGPVQKVSLVDDEFVIYVGDKKYTMDQIMTVEMGATTGTGNGVDPTKFSLKATETTRDTVTMEWQVPTEDEEKASKLKYSLYYSKEPGFSTVEEVEKGTLVGLANVSGLTKENITGLEPGTRYYVNVVVTDGNGKKTVYKPVTVNTMN